jgi:hypothetical protein
VRGAHQRRSRGEGGCTGGGFVETAVAWRRAAMVGKMGRMRDGRFSVDVLAGRGRKPMC